MPATSPRHLHLRAAAHCAMALLAMASCTTFDALPEAPSAPRDDEPDDAGTPDAEDDAPDPTIEDGGAGCASDQAECDGQCFDTDSDPEHCGGCLPCPQAQGAATACANGTCLWLCVGENTDRDGDLQRGPEGNGCECGNAQTEVRCDGIDDDCDGEVDEGVLNACGGCAELDGDPGDPCEPCGRLRCDGAEALVCDLPRNVTQELSCDGLDDDCDGLIDETCCEPQTPIFDAPSNTDPQLIGLASSPDGLQSYMVWLPPPLQNGPQPPLQLRGLDLQHGRFAVNTLEIDPPPVAMAFEGHEDGVDLLTLEDGGRQIVWRRLDRALNQVGIKAFNATIARDIAMDSHRGTPVLLGWTVDGRDDSVEVVTLYPEDLDISPPRHSIAAGSPLKVSVALGPETFLVGYTRARGVGVELTWRAFDLQLGQLNNESIVIPGPADQVVIPNLSATEGGFLSALVLQGNGFVMNGQTRFFIDPLDPNGVVGERILETDLPSLTSGLSIVNTPQDKALVWMELATPPRLRLLPVPPSGASMEDVIELEAGPIFIPLDKLLRASALTLPGAAPDAPWTLMVAGSWSVRDPQLSRTLRLGVFNAHGSALCFGQQDPP